MEKIAIIESLKTCLGRQLISAKRRLYDVEEIAITELDLAEVVLCFDAPDISHYFSWEQVDDKFELSVRSKSHLREQPFPEILAADDALLSKLIGKRLTIFELYANEFGSIVAAMLGFEIECLIVAVGYEPWNAETKKAEFQFFSGDDLFLWKTEEFVDALRKHNLELASHLEAETFV